MAPKGTFAVYYHGNVHLATGKYDQAVADFTEALRLDPVYISALYNRAFAYSEAKKLGKSTAAFREVPGGQRSPRTSTTCFDALACKSQVDEWAIATRS